MVRGGRLVDNDRARCSDIGNLFEFLNNYTAGRERRLSWLSGGWADREQWRIVAKAKVFELLGYFPGEAPLDAETVGVTEHNGYMQEEVRFNTARNVRVAGSLLIPTQGKKPYPAVVALHDHSGFYYYGRERLLEMDDEPEILTAFKQEAYGGRSWASELARRGYVVLTIDAFYFGTRKPDLHAVSSDMRKRYSLNALDSLQPGSMEYIQTYNHLCIGFETLFMRHVMAAGTTWAGILFFDDRRSVDYLLTREEVDSNRIGCCGLSLGGIRSVLLAGLDHRIKASVTAGWMATFESLLFDRLRDHTFMLSFPRLAEYMDIPDLASLSAPGAMLVQQCSQDALYNLKGMQDACEKLEKLYGSFGMPDRVQSNFYDNGHQFNVRMQQDAFEWLDRWLKP
jgi:dienelactone hydrolase